MFSVRSKAWAIAGALGGFGVGGFGFNAALASRQSHQSRCHQLVHWDGGMCLDSKSPEILQEWLELIKLVGE